MKSMFVRLLLHLILLAMLSACGVQSPLVNNPSEDIPTILSPDVYDDGSEYVANSPNKPTVYVNLTYYDFDYILEHCAGIVTAELQSVQATDTGFLLNFSCKEIIWDRNIPKDLTIVLYSYYPLLSKLIYSGEYFKNGFPYEEGCEYILVLNRSESVYHDNPYSTWADTYIPLDGENIITDATCFYGDEPLRNRQDMVLEFTTLQEFKEYVYDLVDVRKPAPATGLSYTHSDKARDIVRDAHCIARVRLDTFVKYNWGSRLVDCKVTVLRNYKGMLPEKLTLSFFDTTVQPGGEYLVCLNVAENNGYPNYALASKNNSVIPIEDSWRVGQYLRLIKNFWSRLLFV